MNKKIALVTGASGGIGQSICRTLKALDFCVVGLDLHDANDGREVIDQFIEIDLADLDALQQVSCELLKSHKISCLVHNAAYQVEKPLRDTSPEDWNRVLNVNLRAPFFLTQYLLEGFERPASIINISSVHAEATSYGIAAYAASKGGLKTLTKSMAIELGPLGIRVNCVIPGAIETPMLQRGLKRMPDEAAARQALSDASPLGRIGQPEDVAQLVGFLADPQKSANITGGVFACDGGVLTKLASE